MYICITGATYIHTKNKAGDNRLQHHESGKTNVVDIHGHAPTLSVVSPPLQPHQHPHSAALACRGEGRGGREACHGTGEGLGRGGERNRVLRARDARHHIRALSHRSLLEGKHRVLCTLHLTPGSSLGPGSFRGGPTSCANGVGHSGMSREPGEAGPAHRGWDGEEGVHTDIRRGGREGLGGSWGPRQLAGLGSRGEGPGQMVI